jgi:hypothetical protein
VATGLVFLLRALELLPDEETDHHLRRRDVVFCPRDLTGTPLWVAINIRSSKVHRVAGYARWRNRMTRLVFTRSCGTGNGRAGLCSAT